MAKSSFNKKPSDTKAPADATPVESTPVAAKAVTETAAAPAPAAASAALAERAPTSIAPADSFFKNDDLEGEFDRSDLQIPGLNLVQSVGPLSEHFEPGQMVYNKEDVVGDKDLATEITLLKMKKFYQEKLPYGSDVMPRRFESQEEARKAGLTPLWEKVDGMGNYEPVLDCTVLVGAPAAGGVVWPFTFADRQYAMARMFIRSVAYSATGKLFISTAQFALQGGLCTGKWNITPKREKVGANMVWIPRAKLVGKHTEEFVSWARTLL